MLPSMVYRLTRRVLGSVAVLLRREASKDAELLVPRHGNVVLPHRRPRPHRHYHHQPSPHVPTSLLSNSQPVTYPQPSPGRSDATQSAARTTIVRTAPAIPSTDPPAYPPTAALAAGQAARLSASRRAGVGCPRRSRRRR